jgi:ketosteroid isomerase-like protein
MIAECPYGKGEGDGGDVEMAAVDKVDELIGRFNLAQGEFLKGNVEAMNDLFSHREDVTLNNPLSPPAHGWEQVASTMERAASQFRDGEIGNYETIEKRVTDEFAYVVRVERATAKVGGSDEVAPIALRVTMIFRLEGDGTWKVVHRHADPITTPRPAESVIRE